MTDKEIIKALACCTHEIAKCEDCPFAKACENGANLMIPALNLIHTQQAEIEQLKNNKCTHTNGIIFKPDGVNELDPCRYDEIERYKNVTVNVLRCPKCGHTEIEWERQEDTICLT